MQSKKLKPPAKPAGQLQRSLRRAIVQKSIHHRTVVAIALLRCAPTPYAPVNSTAYSSQYKTQGPSNEQTKQWSLICIWRENYRAEKASNECQRTDDKSARQKERDETAIRFFD